MDKEHKERKKRMREETTDMLGAARMVSLKGQPFLDQDEEKVYLKHETLDEERGKRKPNEKTRL